MDDTPRRRRLPRLGRAVLVATIAAGLLVATPGVAGFKSGTYSGTTSQPGQHLQLKVNKRKTRVTVVFFELDAPPCGGKGGLQYAGLTTKIKKSGKFNAPSPGDGFYGFVKGKFKGKRASGTAKYKVKASGCDAGDVTWTAEKG